MSTAEAARARIAAMSRWHPAELAFWAATLAVPFVVPSYLLLASQIAIAALFALSLDLVLGYAGLISLGHAAFFGTGAYTAGLLAQAGWGEPITGLVVAGAVAALLGWATSFIFVRVSHLALIMVTLGVSLLLYEAANRATGITGGDDGLQGVFMWKLLGRFEFDLFGHAAYFYALAVLFMLFLVIRRLVHSPFGLTLRGLRENAHRLPALGTPTRLRLRTLYTVSAALAGVAGALLAQTTQFVALEVLGFQRSAEVLIMLVLGGAGRLYGGLVGAALFLVARDQLADMNPQYWFFWLGLLLIVVVLFLPGGILGGAHRLLGKH